MLWPGCGQAQLCPKVLTAVDELIHVNLMHPSHRLICSAVEWLNTQREWRLTWRPSCKVRKPYVRKKFESSQLRCFACYFLFLRLQVGDVESSGFTAWPESANWKWTCLRSNSDCAAMFLTSFTVSTSELTGVLSAHRMPKTLVTARSQQLLNTDWICVGSCFVFDHLNTVRWNS